MAAEKMISIFYGRLHFLSCYGKYSPLCPFFWVGSMYEDLLRSQQRVVPIVTEVFISKESDSKDVEMKQCGWCSPEVHLRLPSLEQDELWPQQWTIQPCSCLCRLVIILDQTNDKRDI